MTAPTAPPVRRARRTIATASCRPKDPISLVAGPYGHPFHPILVTVPIGAWITSLVLDIGSGVRPTRRARWPGARGGPSPSASSAPSLAALFGLLDLLDIPRRTRAFRVGLIHMALNLTVVAAFVVSYIWRDDRGVGVETSGGQIVLARLRSCSSGSPASWAACCRTATGCGSPPNPTRPTATARAGHATAPSATDSAAPPKATRSGTCAFPITPLGGFPGVVRCWAAYE